MSLELDQAKTVLVVIDMTKGVLSLASGPYPVQEVLANTVRLAEAFRRAGSFVVLVNVNIPAHIFSQELAAFVLLTRL